MNKASMAEAREQGQMFVAKGYQIRSNANAEPKVYVRLKNCWLLQSILNAKRRLAVCPADGNSGICGLRESPAYVKDVGFSEKGTVFRLFTMIISGAHTTIIPPYRNRDNPCVTVSRRRHMKTDSRNAGQITSLTIAKPGTMLVPSFMNDVIISTIIKHNNSVNVSQPRSSMECRLKPFPTLYPVQN